MCPLALSLGHFGFGGEGRGGGGVKRSEKIEMSADINFERSLTSDARWQAVRHDPVEMDPTVLPLPC